MNPTAEREECSCCSDGAATTAARRELHAAHCVHDPRDMVAWPPVPARRDEQVSGRRLQIKEIHQGQFCLFMCGK
jgi:hypothetical protein